MIYIVYLSTRKHKKWSFNGVRVVRVDKCLVSGHEFDISYQHFVA